jgi:3-methyl-2-oxobutanoate hydroxymethyltransferase
VQGRAEAAAEQILADAKGLEQAGCFALVLECVPQMLGRKISQALSIPTIGIGAGPFTDGQVLVLQDLLGMQADFKPKFLRHYLAGHQALTDAVNHFHNDVAEGEFPTCQEAYQ